VLNEEKTNWNAPFLPLIVEFLPGSALSGWKNVKNKANMGRSGNG